MSTLLNQLPTDPSVPAKENRIVETPASYKNDLDTTLQVPIPIDMNEMMKNVTKANEQGLTGLNMPIDNQNNTHLTTDLTTTANYVPGQEHPQQQDYIQNYTNSEQVVTDHGRAVNQASNMDTLYETYKLPLIVALLFLVFQLPYFKVLLMKQFTVLFKSDGNYNFKGYIAISALFGGLYHIVKVFLEDY